MQLAIVNKDGEPDESKYLCGLALATIVNAWRRSVPYLYLKVKIQIIWTHLTQTACCRSVSAETAALRFHGFSPELSPAKHAKGTYTRLNHSSLVRIRRLDGHAHVSSGHGLFLRTVHDIRHCLTRPGKFQTAAGSRRSRGGVPERFFNSGQMCLMRTALRYLRRWRRGAQP